MLSSKFQIISGIVTLTLILALVFVSKNRDEKRLLPNQANGTTLTPFTIRGTSMEPTLKDGEQVLVDAAYYKSHRLERGDIIAFKLKTQEKPFVKRAIALPGDKLEFGKDGNIYINGGILEEPYLLDKNFHFDSSKLKVLSIPLSQTNNTVPQGTVMVFGDNRRNSFDSENYGFVPTEYIIGKGTANLNAAPAQSRYFPSSFSSTAFFKFP